MSRETEFLTRHKEDLRRAVELCRLLQRNMVEIAPRTLQYLELRAICKRLEGTSRQMAHERGDDFSWLQLGDLYFRVSKAVTKARNKHDWAAFGEIAKVFEAGIVRVERLATAATGITSRSTSPLLILPRYLQPKPNGLILPS
jgi:hypothetical protein